MKKLENITLIILSIPLLLVLSLMVSLSSIIQEQ